MRKGQSSKREIYGALGAFSPQVKQFRLRSEERQYHHTLVDDRLLK